MKHYCIALLLMVGLNCSAQDSTKTMSRNSISFYGGVNVITGIAPLSFYNWAGAVEPVTTNQPYFSLSYNYLLKTTKCCLFGLKLGIAYSRNEYDGNIPWEIDYSHYPLEQIDMGEFCAGIFVNVTKQNKVGWYNELDFSGSAQLHSTVLYKWNDLDMSKFSKSNDIDMHLFYQTGVSIRVNKNFTLIPLVGTSIIDISRLINQATPYGIYGYMYLRAGMTVTYTFNK